MLTIFDVFNASAAIQAIAYLVIVITLAGVTLRWYEALLDDHLSGC